MLYAQHRICVTYLPHRTEHPLEIHSEFKPHSELTVANRKIVLYNCRIANTTATRPYWIDQRDLFEANPGLVP